MSDFEKPDFKMGVSLASFPEDGKLLGTVDGEDVLLLRRATEFLAIGAHCTPYQGPLADGLIAGDEVAMSLASRPFQPSHRRAVCAPALDPIQCWRVEQIETRSS